MRAFNFKARNIGQEKYLTYTMGEECELDEDVLDYCEENSVKELVDIIYEEDEDYDYLTYDITGKQSIEEFIRNEVSCRQVLMVLRNVAANLISLKEQTIHLAYLIMNKSFIYIDGETMDIEFICLPVESEASVATEFKGFIRQLLANMKYNVDEDLNYVGKLLTYINGDNFNLRGLMGLSEALMEEEGISFDSAADIDAQGVEVVASESEPAEASSETVADFMSSEEDTPLPEIGDDEEDDRNDEPAEENNIEELDSILPAGVNIVKHDENEGKNADEETEASVENKEEKQEFKTSLKQKETDVDVIKNKIKQLVGAVPTAKSVDKSTQSINTLDELDKMLDGKPPVIKKNVVKVNRAALIQSAAAELEETGELTGGDNKNQKTEDLSSDAGSTKDDTPKSNSVLSRTVPEGTRKTNLVNGPKAIPYLIRVNTEERIMLGKPIFKIGKATRGVDYTVDGNGAISRQHAIITQKDGVCYIKDNKSTNHTYVNGRELDEGAEEILTHDSTIRLGDEEFLFKIR